MLLLSLTLFFYFSINFLMYLMLIHCIKTLSTALQILTGKSYALFIYCLSNSYNKTFLIGLLVSGSNRL